MQLYKNSAMCCGFRSEIIRSIKIPCRFDTGFFAVRSALSVCPHSLTKRFNLCYNIQRSYPNIHCAAQDKGGTSHV